jgi:hypothetical protein
MYYQFVQFITINSVLYNSQYGFHQNTAPSILCWTLLTTSEREWTKEKLPMKSSVTCHKHLTLSIMKFCSRNSVTTESRVMLKIGSKDTLQAGHSTWFGGTKIQTYFFCIQEFPRARSLGRCYFSCILTICHLPQVYSR